jgi:hypothetical protein
MTTFHHQVLPGAELLGAAGLCMDLAGPPTSTKRFPDGGAWRVEIPSVEGPLALATVIEAAEHFDVPIHRVSQGSGIMMLTDDEITRMVELAQRHHIELCLFLGPRASWDIGAQRGTPTGNVMGRARGLAAVAACAAEAERATRLGVTSLLVGDEGVLWTLHQLREAGTLPANTQFKVSVTAAPANPASLRLNENLGADTVNIPSDLSISQLAELRAVCEVAVDFYIEAPDGVGGFVRMYDIVEIVRVVAPVYLKFGLRNAPDIYPSGKHLEQVVVATAWERVRRAKLGLDLLKAYAPHEAIPMSPIGSREQPALDRLPTSTISP